MTYFKIKSIYNIFMESSRSMVLFNVVNGAYVVSMDHRWLPSVHMSTIVLVS